MTALEGSKIDATTAAAGPTLAAVLPPDAVKGDIVGESVGQSVDAIEDIDLRELSELQSVAGGRERVFLSVYLGGQAGAQTVARRLDALRRVLEDEDEDDADELEHFDCNVALVQQWLDDHPAGQGSVCVFACYALDLVRGFRLDMELPTDVRVGVAPYVRPLAELQDEYQTFAVVAADNAATRVFLLTATQSEVVGKIRGDIKNHVKKGGWSQKRYERRRDNALHHYSVEVADFLAQLWRREQFDRIVLTGSAETIAAIGAELDPPLLERVIARDTIDLKAGDEALVAQAFEHYWAAERAAEREVWARVRAEYKSGGLAAVGAEDVLEAVQNGRAEVIVAERDAQIGAMRCADCENTAVGTAQTCTFCGASAMIPFDLLNEVTRQAELTGAHVEYADPIPGLTAVGGIAALLRY
jgi:hypothetical protein